MLAAVSIQQETFTTMRTGDPSHPRLLLLSNSRSPDGMYLHWARASLRDFLGKSSRRVLFIPYAEVPGTTENYARYASMVQPVLAELGHELHSIHEAHDPRRAVDAAEVVVVGGGNSFQLLTNVYRHGILETLRERVQAGMPYVGWSAGANLTCPGIWTTNDMPIVEPPSLRALGLVPFQINAHFTEAHVAGHMGETRAERIAEFLALHPELSVIGLRECALIRVEQGTARLVGAGARLFRAGLAAVDLADGAELPFNS